jgi:Phage integrase family
VRLADTVIEELRTWRRRQAEELLRIGLRPDGETFVVTQSDGSPLQPGSITHEWVRLLAAKKLPRIRFHDLRHAHATHLLASGMHPKIASERLGHSKIGITLDLYSHVLPGMQDDAVVRSAFANCAWVFTPESGHLRCTNPCPLRAKRRQRAAAICVFIRSPRWRAAAGTKVRRGRALSRS